MKIAFFGKGSLDIITDLGLSILGWGLPAGRVALVCGLELKPLVAIGKLT